MSKNHFATVIYDPFCPIVSFFEVVPIFRFDRSECHSKHESRIPYIGSQIDGVDVKNARKSETQQIDKMKTSLIFHR